MKNVAVNLERSLLGGLIALKKLDRYHNFVDKKLFFDKKNQLIFTTFKKLCESNSMSNVSLAMLVDALEATQPQKNTDWFTTVSLIIADGCIEIEIIPYAKKLDDLATYRELESTLKNLSSKVDSSKNPHLSEVFANVENDLFNVMQEKEVHDFQSVAKIVEGTIENIKKRVNDENLTGVKTDLTILDSYTGGFQASDLIILAARPSMGKTALALNIAKNVARTKNVGFVSLEMSSEQLTQRLLSTFSLIDLQRLKNPSKIHAEEWVKIELAEAKIKKLHLFIDDTANNILSELMWKVRKLAKIQKLDLLIIDYLQLINLKSEFSIENRQGEVSIISRSLKFLAKELNIPIIALSQLSRQVEKRESKRPMMSDLRDSGAIEQDADLIMFLYREDYYTRHKKSEEDDENYADDNAPQESEIILSKHRNGPTGDFSLLFRSNIGLFSNFLKKDEN